MTPVEGIRVLERVAEAGFIDTFREINRDGDEYTWWPALDQDQPRSRQEGWRLDYQIVGPNFRRHITDAWIDYDATFSEFAPLIVEYDLQLYKNDVA